MSDESFLFFLNWILYIILCALCWINIVRYNNREVTLPIHSSLFLIIGILGSTFFIIAADYYGYVQVLRRLITYTYSTEIEPFYWWLARILNYNIFLFRFLLVVIIYLSYWFIIKYYDLPTTISYSIIIILAFNINAAVLRSSACDAIVWTTILYYFKEPKIRSFILVLLSIFAGWFLHKSAFMIIFLFIMAYFPLKKIIIQLSLILLPVVIIIVRFLIPLIFQHFFETSGYIEVEKGASFIGYVKEILTNSYTIIFSCFLLYNYRKYYKLSKIGSKLYNIFFWAFYCRLVFLFGDASRFIGERLYAHALIPEVILTIFLFLSCSKRVRKQLIFLFFIFMLITQFNILVVYAFNYPAINSNIYINV